MFGWEWKSRKMEKVILRKFTHISVLKNNIQLKKWQKKMLSPKFFFFKNQIYKKKNQCLHQKKKKKQRIGLINLCANINRHFCHIFIKLLLPSFLPILERELFGELRETTHELHYHFPLFLSQPNTLQKVVVVVGFFFCLPPSSSLKSTLLNTP